MSSAPSAPASSAARVSRIASAVALEPVPAMTGTRRRAASTTVRTTAMCSSCVSVADSPVEPQGTSPCTPPAICASTSAASAWWSTAPSRNGVTSAVRQPVNIRYTSIRPSNTSTASPVMCTWSSAPQATVSAPPGSTTSTLRPLRPVRAAATAAAHAPVPHAWVSPAPRSHTRIASRSGPTTRTNSVFTRRGKKGWCSKRGPSAARSSAPGSSTNTTQCGLPSARHVTVHGRPSTVRDCSITGPSASTGMRRPSHSGVPMSRVTRPFSRTQTSSLTPASVSTRSGFARASPRSRTNLASARMPLPHISARLPSALKTSMRQSAAVEGATRMRPSAPMPRWRSQSRWASTAGFSGTLPCASITTKSLPVPCSLAKESVAMTSSPTSLPVGRDRLAAHEILARLAVPYNVVRRTVNQHGGRPRARVVVRRHDEAVRARAHHRQEIAGLRRLELAIPGEEIPALAHRSDDVGDDARAVARTHRADRVVGAVERGAQEIVHRAVDDHEALGGGGLAVDDARDEDARVADERAARLEHERERQPSQPGPERGGIGFRRGRGFLVVGDAHAAAEVEVPQLRREPDVGELIEQMAHAAERVDEGRRVGELRADVAVEADRGHVGQGVRAAIGGERLGDGDAELALLHAGGDVRVRLRVDVGIHPQRHGRAHAEARGDALDGLELLGRLDVEHQDALLERVGDLLGGLADAREHDAPRVGSGAQRLPELAARHDVEAGARAREEVEDREVVVRLHREADEVRRAGERGVEGVEGSEQRRAAVDVERGAVALGEPRERDLLAAKLAVAVDEGGGGVHGAGSFGGAGGAAAWVGSKRTATGPAARLR